MLVVVKLLVIDEGAGAYPRQGTCSVAVMRNDLIATPIDVFSFCLPGMPGDYLNDQRGACLSGL